MASGKKQNTDGTRLAGKLSPWDENIDDEGKKTLAGLSQVLLNRIIGKMDVVSRVNMSLTCRRLYEIESEAPPSEVPQMWSHMAIRTMRVQVGQQRRSHRLALAAPETKIEVEVELRNGGECYAHKDGRRRWESHFGECCFLREDRKIIEPFRTRGRHTSQMAYWKTSLDEAPVLLSSIFMATSVKSLCVKADLSDSTQKWFEKLTQFDCPSIIIEHCKAIGEANGDWRWKEEEEPAVLSRTLFAAGAPFFENTKKLIFTNIRLDENDHYAFYMRAKASMTVEWREKRQ